MVAKYWPVAAPKEENVSPFPVKQIGRNSIAEYLQHGNRYTFRGITLYTKPTDILEVGFLIRRRAGNAVKRNKTRRLFKAQVAHIARRLVQGRGYLFLFHKSFFSSPLMGRSLTKLLQDSGHVV